MARVMQKIVQLIHTPTGRMKREQVEAACDILNKGGVIALPTDTIYGLAAKADNTEALKRIYGIKCRDLSKPLSICVSEPEDVQDVAIVSETLKKVINRLIPGPVTIVLVRAESLNPDLNPGVQSIGVRVPDHNFIRTICQIVGPLALTSANRSGETSPTQVDDFREIWEEIDCIFNGGPIRSWLGSPNEFHQPELGSTVIDLTHPNLYKVIREGQGFHRATSILHRFGLRT